MTDLMRLNLRATEIRARLSELAGVTDLTDEHRSELDTLRNEYRDNEVKTGALMIAGDTPVETVTEDRQLSELRGKVDFGRYVAAALARRGADGAEREYNEERGIDADHFPSTSWRTPPASSTEPRGTGTPTRTRGPGLTGCSWTRRRSPSA